MHQTVQGAHKDRIFELLFRIPYNFGEPVSVGVSDYQSDSRYRRQRFGISFRVTSGDDDTRVRIFSNQLSDRLSRLLVGSMRYRACIYNDEIGIGSRDTLPHGIPVQSFSDRGTIRLIAAATKGLDKKLGARVHNYSDVCTGC
jgi:hypothetical protein